jgi:hypothetical protein
MWSCTFAENVFIAPSGDVQVALTMLSGGLPDVSATLATTTIAAASVPTGAAQALEATFPTPATVSAGTAYAIVLSENAPSGDVHYPWSSFTTNPYAGGGAYRDTGSGFAALAATDFYFQTYVLAATSSAGEARAGYCLAGIFVDLVLGQPDADPARAGATPAIFVAGEGITCDAPPAGYTRQGFAGANLHVPEGLSTLTTLPSIELGDRCRRRRLGWPELYGRRSIRCLAARRIF